MNGGSEKTADVGSTSLCVNDDCSEQGRKRMGRFPGDGIGDNPLRGRHAHVFFIRFRSRHRHQAATNTSAFARHIDK